MTVVTISNHLTSGPGGGGDNVVAGQRHMASISPSSLQLAGSTSDIDRFSLSSNLSGSSPRSGLTSPLSSSSSSASSGDGDNASQTSLCYSAVSTQDPSSLHHNILNNHEHHDDHNNITSTQQQHQRKLDEHQLATAAQLAKLHIASQQHPQQQQLHNNNNNISFININDKHVESNKQRDVLTSGHFNSHAAAAAAAQHALRRQSLQARQALSLPQPPTQALPAPTRRLSRIEHRQSLSDLGYGKIETYIKLQQLGKGTYATVYMGRSRLSNDLVALKEILKEHDEGAPCTAIREVSLLRLLRHNNIVTLHDICHTPKKLTLVFEYVGPDLYAYMKENNHLLSIHNVRVLHRDLKPQNLLINSRGELKICDFGLARAKSIPTKSYSNEVVTLWYRPPDVLLGNTDYDHSIDMWGVGCIFFEMASGRTFFPGTNVRQQLYMIFSSLGAPNRYNWPEILNNPEYKQHNFPSFRPEKLIHRCPRLDMDGLNLLMKFLRYRPQERISADEARRDPFFACLPENIHHLKERESIFDVDGIYMTMNPGQKLNHM